MTYSYKGHEIKIHGLGMERVLLIDGSRANYSGGDPTPAEQVAQRLIDAMEDSPKTNSLENQLNDALARHGQRHHFSSIEDARTFMLAGNAILTLESLKTGRHFTYSVEQSKDKPRNDGRKFEHPVHFVKLLSDGSADDGTFRYLGIIRQGQFSLTGKSCASPEAPSVKAFQFFMSLSELHPQLVIRHEGKCGRCGRTLTVPESIDRGIGSECAAKMGLE